MEMHLDILDFSDIEIAVSSIDGGSTGFCGGCGVGGGCGCSINGYPIEDNRA